MKLKIKDNQNADKSLYALDLLDWSHRYTNRYEEKNNREGNDDDDWNFYESQHSELERLSLKIRVFPMNTLMNPSIIKALQQPMMAEPTMPPNKFPKKIEILIDSEELKGHQ